MNYTEIEVFFLKNLLKISLACVAAILIANMVVEISNINYIVFNAINLMAILMSFIFLKRKMYNISALIFTTVPFFVMLYRLIKVPSDSLPLIVIMVIGFAISFLINGKLRWFMHMIVVMSMIFIFTIHAQTLDVNYVIILAITFIGLYLLLVFSAGLLKSRYDRVTARLKNLNSQLIEKSCAIEEQNEKLLKNSDDLTDENKNLEVSIKESSARIIEQNNKILKFAHYNAHELRAPVARLKGLIYLTKIDQSIDMNDILKKIEFTIEQIDSILSKINTDLEKS